MPWTNLKKEPVTIICDTITIEITEVRGAYVQTRLARRRDAAIQQAVNGQKGCAHVRLRDCDCELGCGCGAVVVVVWLVVPVLRVGDRGILTIGMVLLTSSPGGHIARLGRPKATATWTRLWTGSGSRSTR